LEVRDQVQSDKFPLTHEFIAEMLGIRRSGVSEAAEKLTAKSIINQKRGQIRIVDLPGLLKMSCECYGSLRDEYNRLLE
jgi:hypothetical protein